MTTELLIVGGERVSAAEEGTFTVIEPGNGSPMGEVAEAGPEDARRAVDVALQAFEEGPWPRTSATGGWAEQPMMGNATLKMG